MESKYIYVIAGVLGITTSLIMTNDALSFINCFIGLGSLARGIDIIFDSLEIAETTGNLEEKKHGN